jgi:spore maturation protein CgeB
MKVAVVDTVYEGYVAHLYRDAALAQKSYDDQYRATVEGGFPTLSSWVEPLRAKGHEVIDIWANHMPLQSRWCEDHGIKITRTGDASVPEFVDIVAEQIRYYRPDVILSGYLYDFDSRFLRSVSDHYKIAVGQHAASLPQTDFSEYDAIISSLPNQVAYFSEHGVASYLVKLAFDARLLSRLVPKEKRYGLIFAGSISADHKLRAESLRALGESVPVDVFGTVPDEFMRPRSWLGRIGQSLSGKPKSKIALHEALWGMEMYKTMSESRIVFNRHIDAAGPYANNLRLYEAVGSGSLLLTDWKENMDEIFTPGRECATYRDTAECVAQAKYYLQNDAEREAIAQAGRRRLLHEHTYEHRVDELLEIIGRHIC